VETLGDFEMMITWTHPHRRRATPGDGAFASR
jgi:hypothetical protein